MEVEYGAFFLSSYQQGSWVATGGRQAAGGSHAATPGGNQQDSRALPLPGCRFFPGPALPQPTHLLGEPCSDMEHVHPGSSDNAAEQTRQPPLMESSISTASRVNSLLDALPSTASTTASMAVPDYFETLQNFDSQPGATAQRSSKLQTCGPPPEETTHTEATATTADGASPRLLDPSPRESDSTQGIRCENLTPRPDAAVSPKEEQVDKLCMEEQPTHNNEAHCNSQPEPEQEVTACANETSEHEFGMHVGTKQALELDVSPLMPSEAEEAELPVVPQAPSVHLSDLVETPAAHGGEHEVGDHREVEIDEKLQVSGLIDKLFESHEQACFNMAMTCRRLLVWDLHRPRGQRFKVQAPEPHPGLEYRLTKRLHDRAGKQARNGDVVEGFIEECGLWLLVEMAKTKGVATHYYLPMRVGDHQLVEEIDPPQQPRRLHRAKTIVIQPQTCFCSCEEPAPPKEQFKVIPKKRYTTTASRGPITTLTKK